MSAPVSFSALALSLSQSLAGMTPLERLAWLTFWLQRANLAMLCAASSTTMLLVMGSALLGGRLQETRSKPLPKAAAVVAAAAAAATPATAPAPTSFDPKNLAARLVTKRSVSRDTVLFEFELPGFHPSKLPVGKHLKVFAPNASRGHATWNNKPNPEREHAKLERKYTPCAVTSTGFVLVVKIYSPNSNGNSNFPQGGKVTQHLAQMQVGQHVECALPFGLIEYVGPGKFKRSKAEHPVQRVGMVAGGSGLTPMLRLLEHSLHDAHDRTKFSLLFANRDQGDIILRSRLDELHQQFPQRFRLEYILSKPDDEWAHHRGYITKELLAAVLPPPGPDALILVCGPPVMIHNCVKDNLVQLGYSTQQVWDF